MSIVWLIAFVVFLAVEGMTASLTSIWFAGGSLAALMAQVLGGGLKIQLLIFVLPWDFWHFLCGDFLFIFS